jgi:hypothetical protein
MLAGLEVLSTMLKRLAGKHVKTTALQGCCILADPGKHCATNVPLMLKNSKDENISNS